MRTKNQERFESVIVEGAVLPADMVRQIAGGNKAIEGLKPVDYHLAPGERINEAASRAWNRLVGLWQAFKDKRNELTPDDSGRGMTREQWLLPLFQELGYGRLQRAETFVIEEKEYPISHMWLNSPIHLMGCGVDPDRRKKGEPGASSASPHSLVQEFLNRSDDHLWGFVSNGLKLRLLRDNVSLTRQAFIEFDLETMMEGEIYSDFVVLWLLCHQSRVEADKPEDTWLEKWHRMARASGIRILDNLRDGVEKAITALGQGFLSHQANKELIETIRTGALSPTCFYHQLRIMVYRLIFLLVAENRDLLLLPEASPEAKERYNNYYSISRLREIAARPGSGAARYTDLWRGVQVIFDLLGKDQGYPDLALPGLGSFLWSKQALPQLMNCTISNRDFLKAVYSLSFVIDKNVRHKVDYKNLGPEELGSVYEALLELHPEVNTSDGSFELKSAGGSERKTTGTYYTPTSLIVSLLDTALEPILKQRKTEKEILGIKVCDPACGSGHFLLAAAHRIARRLAAVRTGEPEPSPADLRTALRDVIGHCIYGVDINPMSVELCKVGLWMEALEPGKPLSFLDHRILCGNSLIGAYPALMKKGIPDEAFTPIEGDDKKVCQKYKKLNREERGSMSKRSLYDAAGEAWFGQTDFSMEFVNLDAIDDTTMQGIHHKQAAYKQMMESDNYKYNRLVADAWCAAFAWKKQEVGEVPYPIHEEVFRNIEKNPLGIPQWIKDEISRLAGQYQFFHFYLAFPDVFWLQKSDETPENPHTGWSGGFDVVLGNPPWEKIQLEEKQFFEYIRPDITKATSSKRRKIISDLSIEDPILWQKWLYSLRASEGTTHILKNSGLFPFGSKGNINTYTIFLEQSTNIRSSEGRIGLIIPSGIASDETTKLFFQELMKSKTLFSLYDFENRKKIFPAIDIRTKFCLITITGTKTPNKNGAEFAFFLHNTSELHEKNRIFTLTSDIINLINPNTKTCPIFRRRHDAEIVKKIYLKLPILMSDNDDSSGWECQSKQMLNITHDSENFREVRFFENIKNDDLSVKDIIEYKSIKWIRLYEGKMTGFFDHRQASVFYSSDVSYRTTKTVETSFEEHVNPSFTVQPQFFVREDRVLHAIPEWYIQKWFITFKRIASSTNERTMIASIVPWVGLIDAIPVIYFKHSVDIAINLLANLNAFVFDFVTRSKVGGLQISHFILKQLPVVPPIQYTESTSWEQSIKLAEWITPRVLELTYTAWDLRDFAKDCGYDGPPFVWDEERRFLLRCELDAAYFHLYGISKEDVDYIMDSFPIVKRKDQTKYGSYRTKEKILEIYEKMSEAITGEKAYETVLDPSPADPSIAHPKE
ncbi:MAG: N-6 DNA methylase [Candidatus Aminicenantes bacterium]